MKKPTPTDFEPNDFVIRLRPHMEQEEWHGDRDWETYKLFVLVLSFFF